MGTYEIVPVDEGNGESNYYLQTNGFECVYETLSYMDYLKRHRRHSLKTLRNKITGLYHWYTFISSSEKEYNDYFTVNEQLEFIEYLEKLDNKNKKAILYVVGGDKYSKGLTFSTMSIYIATIREFYQFLYDYHLIELSKEQLPFRRELKVLPEKRKKQKLPETLTLEEVKVLVNECTNYRDKALILTMVSTGLRIGELCSLKMQALDFKHQTINLRRQFLDMQNGTLKTGERKLKGNKIMFAALQKYFIFERGQAAKCDNVFITLHSRKYDRGQPLTDNTIKQMFTRLRNKTGIKNCHAHILRHTFATLFLSMRKDKKSKVSLPILKNLMGHKNISSTMIYTHVDYSIEDLNIGETFERVIEQSFSE